jgi:hypothetical protein
MLLPGASAARGNLAAGHPPEDGSGSGTGRDHEKATARSAPSRSLNRCLMIPVAPVPGLEPAFEVAATLGPLEDHGATRVGHRRVVPFAGIRGSDSVPYTDYRVT